VQPWPAGQHRTHVVHCSWIAAVGQLVKLEVPCSCFVAGSGSGDGPSHAAAAAAAGD